MNKALGILFLRLIIGFIFFMQGVGKIFEYGLDNVYMNFKPYEEILPVWVLETTNYFTSYVEFIGGGLLVLGLFRNISIYLLAFVLVIVTFGHGLIEPIWSMEHVIYRTVLLLPLFFFPEEWDKYKLDRFLRRNTGF